MSMRSNLDRRAFLASIAAGAASSVLPGCRDIMKPFVGSDIASRPLAGSRPNIIFIMADDLDAQEVSCYGGSQPVTTPNIDRLASSGVQFRLGFNMAMCGPTRHALRTGCYAHQTGIWHNNMAVFGTEPNRPEADRLFFQRVVRDSGYKTVVVGKWDGGRGMQPGSASGWDELCIWPRRKRYLPENCDYEGDIYDVSPDWQPTSRYWEPFIMENGKFRKTGKDDFGPDLYTDYLLDLLGRHTSSSQPFMAYYSMTLPHARGNGGHTTVPNLNNLGRRTMDVSRIVDRRKNIEYIDHLVGRVVQGLEATGLDKNTIVIFTADNGAYGPRGKGTGCEPGSWAPFIVSCPALIESRGMTDEMVSIVDILPTMAELAGAPVPQGIDGISFVPVLEGQLGQRDHIFAYSGADRLVRDRRWLLEAHHESSPGRFYDCGSITSGNSFEPATRYYKDVTDSEDTEVLAARERFTAILKRYPCPKGKPTIAQYRKSKK